MICEEIEYRKNYFIVNEKNSGVKRYFSVKHIGFIIFAILIIIFLYSIFNQRKSTKDAFYDAFPEANDNFSWMVFKSYWTEYPRISEKIYLISNGNIDRTVDTLRVTLTNRTRKAKEMQEIKTYLTQKVVDYEMSYYSPLEIMDIVNMANDGDIKSLMVFNILNSTEMKQLIPDDNDLDIFYLQEFYLPAITLDFKTKKLVYGLEAVELYVNQLAEYNALIAKSYHYNNQCYILRHYMQWYRLIFPNIAESINYLMSRYSNYSLLKIYSLVRDISLYYSLEWNISYEDSIEFLTLPICSSISCPGIKFYMPYPELDIIHEEIAISFPIDFINVLNGDELFREAIVLPGQFVLPFSRDSALKDGVEMILVDYNGILISYDIKRG